MTEVGVREEVVRQIGGSGQLGAGGVGHGSDEKKQSEPAGEPALERPNEETD